MRSSLARRVITLLLAQSLFPPHSLQPTTETLDPRRTQPVVAGSVRHDADHSISNFGSDHRSGTTIRVALTTDARSAVISTTGHLMNASGGWHDTAGARYVACACRSAAVVAVCSSE